MDDELVGAGHRRPTIRDVASRAGVSVKTVSRVINGEGNVRSGTITKVEEAVVHLGYAPDDRARQLRAGSGRSMTIGFIQVDVANPFFSSIFRGIEDVAVTNGYQVIAGSSDGRSAQQDAVLRALVARRVDGIIAVPSSDQLERIAAEADRGTPFVFLDLAPAVDVRGDQVRSDHYGGAAKLTEHLLNNGHSRIAFVGDNPSIYSAEQRYAGYADTMARAGLDTPPGLIHRGVSAAHGGREAVLEMLRLHRDDAPTALFTAQNFITIGAVRALHELNLQFEIAHVGYDDIDLADLVEPALTVMPQSPRTLGGRAAARLFERLAGDEGPSITDVVQNEIIVRGSGEIRPQSR